MWLVGVVVRRFIDILIIIINFPYSTCIRSFFGSSILTSLFILKMFFRSLYIGLRKIPFYINFHAGIDTVCCFYAYVYIILTPNEYYMVLPALAINAASKLRLEASALHAKSFI